jgi:hypothetical protein
MALIGSDTLTIWFIDKTWHEECLSYIEAFNAYGTDEEKNVEINEHYSEYRAAARAYDDASKKYVARDVREDYLQVKQEDFRNATHKFLAWLETIKS